MKKFLLITAIVFIVVIVAFVAVIKIYVTPERVKAFLVPVAEKALNRKVELGEISIGLFKGIGVRDFAIKETDEKTDFVSCRDFVLKFKLLPLLSKQVIIDELRLASPAVRIERDLMGKFNFQDIGQKTEESKEEKPEVPSEGLPISLLISSVSVTDSRFSFIDRTKEIPDVKGALSVEMAMQSSGGGTMLSEGNMVLTLEEMIQWKPTKKIVRDISARVDYKARVNPDAGEILIESADLKIQNIVASLTGRTKNLTATPEIDLSLTVPNTKLEDTLALLSNFADVKGIDVSGSFSSKLNIKGMPQKIDSLKTDTEISLNKIALTHDNIPVRLEGVAKLQTTSDNVQIEKVDLKVLDIPVVINGDAKNLRKSPYVDITVTVPRVKATELQKAVAPFSKLIGIGTSGALEAGLNVKGSPDILSEMTATGDVSFEKISVKYQDIDAMLDGGVKLKDNVMNIDLNATYAQNTASLKGSVKNLFKNQDITLNVYSQRLNLDRLIPAPADKEKPAAAPESPGPEKPLKEADPLDLTLAARGEIKIDAAVYKGLNMSDFLVNYEFKNNKLTIATLKGKAGKGAFDLKPFVDLSKPGYTYNLSGNIDSLYIEEIINAFFPKAKDKAFGIISANLKMNGSGTLPESMKKNLVASADITMREGKITNMPILSNLAMLFNAKELETIHVRQGSGTMSANNGRARLDILITSDDVKMDPKGNIGLLDEDLDLAFDLKLSPRLKGKAMSSSYSEYLSDEAGWGRIPVKCPGSLSKPKCTPDIAKAGTRAVEKELDRQVDKLFKKKEGEESPETEAVKGLLKGILGK